MTDNSSLLKRNRAFTLIELIVVMIIISSLAVLIIGNFTSTLKKGRDAKRKSDLSQLRQVLEMYFEDQKHYPFIPVDEYNPPNYIITPQGFIRKQKAFIDSTTNKTYMGRLPGDPNSQYQYVYTTNATGTYYRLFSCLENKNDTGEGVSQTGYVGAPSSCGCSVCTYTVFSPNITPLPTM